MKIQILDRPLHIFYDNLMPLYEGKPTRRAPIPKPLPWRAVTPMLGEKMSSTANTAAAAIVTVRISSMGRLFRGMKTSAKATATPSTTYLIMRVSRSFMSILSILVPQIFLQNMRVFWSKRRLF